MDQANLTPLSGVISTGGLLKRSILNNLYKLFTCVQFHRFFQLLCVFDTHGLHALVLIELKETKIQRVGTVKKLKAIFLEYIFVIMFLTINYNSKLTIA